MRPSIRCARHHCRTIFNPVTYDLQRSYNSLPFKPKSLFYPHSSKNIEKVANELRLLKRLDPGIQIVTASLDMKYKDVIGEAWFDRPMKINSFKPYKEIPDSGEQLERFRMVIHNKKIDLSFIHMFLDEQMITIYFKQPHGDFSNLLNRLDVELPFDKDETTYTSKSQYKAISGNLKVTKVCVEDFAIQKFNGLDAGILFQKLKDSTEVRGKDYKYLLEVNEKGKRNRLRIYDEHYGGDDLGLLTYLRPPPIGTSCKIYQLCMDDLYTPTITNGLSIEKHHNKNLKEFIRDDIILENVLALGATSGFVVDGRNYVGFGDHVLIEAIE